LAGFDDLVAAFIAAPKKVLRSPRWRTKGHPDYAELTISIGSGNARNLRGQIKVTAHVLRDPPKYGFCLLFNRHEVARLDVHPGRTHRNLLDGTNVSGTHWHRWPAMDVALPEARACVFRVWLHEFLEAANVKCGFRVGSPPRGQQMDLSQWLGK
jgi:hypothetical protein